MRTYYSNSKKIQKRKGRSIKILKEIKKKKDDLGSFPVASGMKWWRNRKNYPKLVPKVPMDEK